MSISDWVLIGTTLFLGIIAIWGDRIKQGLFPPEITVTFEEEAPYCHKTSYRNPRDLELNEPVYYFRFKVENTGINKLKNCEAKLEQLWIYNSAGKPQKLSGWNDISLVWAGGRGSTIDLDPHRKAYCDIGHVASEQFQQTELHFDIPGKHNQCLRFVFEEVEIPFSQPNCLVPGRYAIEIILYSENTLPKELWFEIAWSGKWQDSEAEMFRELTINKIAPLEKPPVLKRLVV